MRGIYSPILKFDEFELFRTFLRAFEQHPLKEHMYNNELDNRTLTGIDNVKNFVRIQVSNGDDLNGELKARKILKARKVQKFKVVINDNANDSNNNNQKTN